MRNLLRLGTSAGILLTLLGCEDRRPQSDLTKPQPASRATIYGSGETREYLLPPYRVGGNHAQSPALAAADMNGDGRVDLIALIPQVTHTSVCILYNNGDGTYTTSISKVKK